MRHRITKRNHQLRVRACGGACLPALVFGDINICIVCFDVYKKQFLFRVSLTGSTKRCRRELEASLKLGVVTVVVVVIL